MKIVVIGATGGTGRQVVMQALEIGHEVTAIVRSPEKVDIRHKRLEVIKGDVLEPSSIAQTIVGKDAIISALGVSHRKPTSVYSDGTNYVMKAMHATGVRRLICLSSAGLEIPTDTPMLQRLVIKHIIQKMYKNAYEDMERMEAKVQISKFDWTIIRPPRLTNGAKTGTYRTAINESLPHAQGISRADLADYMVRSLTDQSSYHAVVEISN
ncbi:NAD(P)-dependent oxidoreductase [Cohnella sp. WQ 127256]|uniref:NAD(P)-dependent oxidoreductase n=1 Tax=Cohnella sp. WQ 127256 TaxID=2938790 RepID=UPI0021182F8A|nr:SDR family oxidoreductase [Cohnella sp. WQ 127256]